MLLLADARAVREHLDGIGRFSVSVVQSLTDLRPEWDIRVVAAPQGAHHLADPQVEVLLCEAPRFGIKERYRLPRMVRSLGADAYLNFSMAGPVVPAPSIVTIHDLMVLQLKGYFGDSPFRNILSRSLFGLLVRRSALTARAIAVPSQATKRFLRNAYGKRADKAFVTGEGQDMFDPSAPPTARREGFLLYVGNARAYKNLPRLIAGFERLLGQVQDAPSLVMVVRRDRAFAAFERLLSRSPAADRINVLSGLSEDGLKDLYSTCMALIMPSICEGFGLPALEAMAAGTPVLASKGTALEEVVAEAGLLVDPFSIQDIMEGMLKLTSDADLRKKLSDKALARSKRFTWRRTAEVYAEKIEEIV
jgi:glycosyltransferase involved in cell wall biosynthesis